MNPIIRNLFSVFKRYKLATTLNILGLSVAFAAFMLIMIQLNYDFGYDRFHKNSDKIFRVEASMDKEVWAILSRPFSEVFFDSSPHIVAGALHESWGASLFLQVEKDGNLNSFKENTNRVTPEFLDVFDFDIVEGDKDMLKKQENLIMIPLSMSKKFFGNESGVGKPLKSNWEKGLTVGAVYRDFPTNSIIENTIYYAIPEQENKENWGNWNYTVFIRVNEAENVTQLFENFKRTYDAKGIWGDDFNWEDSDFTLRFTPLPDIHFVTDVKFDQGQKASKQMLLILFAIAIVIITIAIINFTNFSTALTPMRIRSINTQRVLGARQSALRFTLITEAMVISLLSFGVALFLIVFFSNSNLVRWVDADLSLSANPVVVAGSAFVALISGLIAGIYPSLYMTSFAPALVLKGSFGLSPKGKKLRNTLISIQYIASFALIIGATIMFLQNRFMQNTSLGYDKDTLLTVNIGQIQNKREPFTQKLKTFAGIEDVVYSQFLLSSSDDYMRWGREYKGETIHYYVFPVNPTFLQVLGIELTEGRYFREEDKQKVSGVYIFNETAHKQFNLELNDMLDESGEIIGFMPDVKFASFRRPVEAMAFYVFGTDNWGDNLNNAYIKVKAGTNIHEVIAHIRTTLAEYDSDYPFNIRFYDEILQKLYEKEIALSSLITLFSLIAIFISIVGVFGLVVFDSECRRKEIGIRKVMGASTMEIILMFNKSYAIILVICFAVAAPLSWYGVQRWLQNFAYKTPIYWWVYLLAFAAITLVTVFTVTFQNWRVANDNPVKAIKAE